MSQVYFISHPEVRIDPQVPVPQWDLSEEGLRRLALLLTQPWIGTIGAVFSSAEQKAKTAAERIAHAGNLPVSYLPALGEIDRSATGYLPPEEHDRVGEEAFAQPDESIRGWERAVDAQRRVVAAVDLAIGQAPPGTNIAIVAHGGIGTLLLNHLKAVPISRADAPPGQGYYFVFARETGELIHGWQAIDMPAPVETTPQHGKDRDLMNHAPASTAFSVRPATLDDAAILARHRCEMFLEMGSLAESAYADLAAAAARYFAEALPAGEYRAWLVAPQARPDQIVAGGGLQLRRILPRPGADGLLLPPGPQGLIMNVYTEPAWRRRGLATLLIETMIAWSRENGVVSLVLHASSAGRPLYERLGFVDTNELAFPMTRE